MNSVKVLKTVEGSKACCIVIMFCVSVHSRVIWQKATLLIITAHTHSSPGLLFTSCQSLRQQLHLSAVHAWHINNEHPRWTNVKQSSGGMLQWQAHVPLRTSVPSCGENLDPTYTVFLEPMRVYPLRSL